MGRSGKGWALGRSAPLVSMRLVARCHSWIVKDGHRRVCGLTAPHREHYATWLFEGTDEGFVSEAKWND